MAKISSKTRYKYDKFILKFMETGNASLAAKFAGYSKGASRQTGYKLLRVEYIKNKLAKLRAEEEKELLSRHNISREAIRNRLAAIAFGSIKQVCEWDEKSMSFIPKEDCENPYLIKSIQVNKSYSESGESHSQKITMEDRVKALQLLGESIDMFKDPEKPQTDKKKEFRLNYSLDD